MDFIVYIAPIVAGFITSVIIPLMIKSIATKILRRKIDEIDSSKEFKEVKKELKDLKESVSILTNEILELRGKRK